MILEIEEGFAIDLSRVESMEQSGKKVLIKMYSRESYRVGFDYKTLLGLWKKESGKMMSLLSNIDNNTFAPRI